MLGMAYGDQDSIEFTEQVTKEMAIVGWKAALALSEEKGPAPIMEEDFTITAKMLRTRPEMEKDGIQVGDIVKGKVLHARYSRYMQQLAEIEPDLVKALEEKGGRFTHHSSIAHTNRSSPLLHMHTAALATAPLFARPESHRLGGGEHWHAFHSSCSSNASASHNLNLREPRAHVCDDAMRGGAHKRANPKQTPCHLRAGII